MGRQRVDVSPSAVGVVDPRLAAVGTADERAGLDGGVHLLRVVWSEGEPPHVVGVGPRRERPPAQRTGQSDRSLVHVSPRQPNGRPRSAPSRRTPRQRRAG